MSNVTLRDINNFFSLRPRRPDISEHVKISEVVRDTSGRSVGKLHSPPKLERLATQIILKNAACLKSSQTALPKKLSVMINEEAKTILLTVEEPPLRFPSSKTGRLVVVRRSTICMFCREGVQNTQCEICKDLVDRAKLEESIKIGLSSCWPECSPTYHKWLKARENQSKSWPECSPTYHKWLKARENHSKS